MPYALPYKAVCHGESPVDSTFSGAVKNAKSFPLKHSTININEWLKFVVDNLLLFSFCGDEQVVQHIFNGRLNVKTVLKYFELLT